MTSLFGGLDIVSIGTEVTLNVRFFPPAFDVYVSIKRHWLWDTENNSKKFERFDKIKKETSFNSNFVVKEDFVEFLE